MDLEASAEGAPFPSIEISVGAGIGAGFSASLSYGYEAANCFSGYNCEPCIQQGERCTGEFWVAKHEVSTHDMNICLSHGGSFQLGHADIPDGQCCYPNQNECQMGYTAGGTHYVGEPQECVCELREYYSPGTEPANECPVPNNVEWYN